MPNATPSNSVLFLSEVINCNDGIASYCQTLAAGLKDNGVKVHFVTGLIRSNETSEGKRKALENSVESLVVIPGLTKWPKPAHLKQIAEIIRRENIRTVNVHGLGMLLCGRLLSLMTGAHVVATYHPSVLGDLNTVLKESQQKFSAGQQIYLNLFFPDYLVVMSEESLAYIRSHNLLYKDRVIKIMAGTDLSHFAPATPEQRAAARKKYNLKDDDFVCVLTARLAWVKGQDLLVDAVRRLRVSHPELSLKCLLVGSGGKEREQEIISMAHKSPEDHDSFRFLGFMSDVRETLWASDVFVLPSRIEGFPISVLEAMSSGLVPVRTPAGGASDQIQNGETGFIVPFEDPQALAEALLKLTDAPLRKKMSERAIAYAQSAFRIDTMVTHMMDAFGMSRKA